MMFSRRRLLLNSGGEVYPALIFTEVEIGGLNPTSDEDIIHVVYSNELKRKNTISAEDIPDDLEHDSGLCVIIGEGIKKIAQDACRGKYDLTEISVPTTLEVIEQNAFAFSYIAGLVGLENSKVRSIGGGAFRNCPYLYSLYCPNTLITLGSVYDSGLKKSVGPFYSTSVHNLTLGNSLYNVPSYCFYGGNTQVILPDSVRSLSPNCFRYTFYNGEIRIPDGVTYIPDNAFYQSSFSKIILGNNVGNIGSFAFAYWAQHSNNTYILKCYTTTPPICYSNTFYNCLASRLEVPANAVSAYQNDSIWGTYFFNKIYAIEE